MSRLLRGAIVCLLSLALVACAGPREPADALPPASASLSALPSPATSATSAPMPTAFPSETPMPPPLTWERLKNAAYLLPKDEGGPEDGQLPMEDGVFTWAPIPGSASVYRYLVYPGVAFGDLDGDSVDDAVVIIVNVSPGSGTFYHLTAVLNAGGQPRPLDPTLIGDRVVVEEVRIAHGVVHLQFKTYRPDEPFGSTPTLQVARRFAVRERGLELLSEDVLNADEVVSETEARDVASVVLPDAGGWATYTGTMNAFGLDEYTLHGVEGQTLAAKVRSSHEDVFLSIIALDSGHVPVRAQDEVSSWRGSLPATSEYAINVFAIGSETAYTITIETAGLPTPPAPPPETPAPPPSPAQGGGAVYLTFDDGPLPPYTREMLDLLAQFDARVTFFVLGQNAQTYGDLLQAAYQNGHSLGNHTWSHRSLSGISQEEFNGELLQTATVLGPNAVPCIRPPYGATDSFTRAYAAELGYEVIIWNVDTLDWKRPGPGAIVSTVLEQVYPGAIVLMHDGGGDRTQTVAALAQVLRELTSQGYTLEALCR